MKSFLTISLVALLGTGCIPTGTTPTNQQGKNVTGCKFKGQPRPGCITRWMNDKKGEIYVITWSDGDKTTIRQVSKDDFIINEKDKTELIGTDSYLTFKNIVTGSTISVTPDSFGIDKVNQKALAKKSNQIGNDNKNEKDESTIAKNDNKHIRKEQEKPEKKVLKWKDDNGKTYVFRREDVSCEKTVVPPVNKTISWHDRHMEFDSRGRDKKDWIIKQPQLRKTQIGYSFIRCKANGYWFDLAGKKEAYSTAGLCQHDGYDRKYYRLLTNDKDKDYEYYVLDGKIDAKVFRNNEELVYEDTENFETYWSDEKHKLVCRSALYFDFDTVYD